MELWVGAGLACVGIAVGIGQWLIPPDKITYKLRIGLTLFACVLALIGVGLLGYAVLNGRSEQGPRLRLYFNGAPLDDQRIPIKVSKLDYSTVMYEFMLPAIEVREEGKKTGAAINTVRLRLSEKGLSCFGYGCGILEPTDDSQYPTVLKGGPFSINAGDRQPFPPLHLQSLAYPPSEIQARFELLYGPPDPARAAFVLVIGYGSEQ